MNLDTSLSDLNRVGRTTATKLKTLGLLTVGDLLRHWPFRYDDFSKTIKIAELNGGQRVNVLGRLEMIATKRTSNRRLQVTEALLADDSGMIKAVWFNQPFIATNLKVGDRLSLSGKVESDFSGPYLLSPIYEKISATGGVHTVGLVPNYHLTAGLTQKQLRFLIQQALPATFLFKEWLPEKFLSDYDLLPLIEAIRAVHFPGNSAILAAARRRLAFDELLTLQLEAQAADRLTADWRAEPLIFDEPAIKTLVAALPFALTDDQRRAAWEIILDIGKDRPMLRLLEGDVGSGKTLVAMLAMYNAALNKRQAALMAPTEILAKQHYATFLKYLGEHLTVGLAVSSTRRLSNRAPDAKLSTATVVANADIVIGTQALLNEKATFRDLVLVVIDEQHRFGVRDRQRLAAKGAGYQEGRAPHLLSMTATPIPRTLALALYRNLALSIIKQSPSGRQPIITELYQEAEREAAYHLINQQLKQGRQAFVICPLIEDSEISEAKSAKSEAQRLQRLFPAWRIGLLHGKLKAKEKEAAMAEFAAGNVDVLVATAVVEVGIDVPNATVVLIESAERFGLAQLHQYRGRVGRGQHQSYCLLLAGDLKGLGRQRLECLRQLSNGFDLAKADLRFRGPGEVYGTLQKGFPELKIADLFDEILMSAAQKAAARLLDEDPDGLIYPAVWQRLSDKARSAHQE